MRCPFEAMRRWGSMMAAMEMASPIFTPPGSFEPKNGAVETTGAILIRAKKKRVKTEMGGIPGMLRRKLT
jgi:hypothetical protein